MPNQNSNNKAFAFKGIGKIDQPEALPDQGQSSNWQLLSRLALDHLDDPVHYLTEDDGLIAAVNTSLTLGMPLLLTGAPGVGKTQLAYRIAYELGCQTIFFPVKSASEAQDLFFHIDHLRRLHAAQIEKHSAGQQKTQDSAAKDPVNIRHFIRFQGLGLAILRAMSQVQLKKRQLWQHAWPESDKDSPNYGAQQPSLVLIDEIDKAPMDFCNDMLEEIRRLQFMVPELGSEPLSIYNDPKQPQEHEKHYRPQIIITSNSEKGLPEPFLRRCIFYHIKAPDKKNLQMIIDKRLQQAGVLEIALEQQLQAKSLDFFLYLRDQARLERPPSTSELLNWFLIMNEHREQLTGADADDRWLESAGFCLLKDKNDQDMISNFYDSWEKPS